MQSRPADEDARSISMDDCDDEPRLVPNNELLEQVLRNDIEIMIAVEAILAKRAMDIEVSETAIRKQVGKTLALLERLK